MFNFPRFAWCLSVSTRPQCLPHKNWKSYTVSVFYFPQCFRSLNLKNLGERTAGRVSEGQVTCSQPHPHGGAHGGTWEKRQSVNLRNFQKHRKISLFSWLYRARIMLDVWKGVTWRAQMACSVYVYIRSLPVSLGDSSWITAPKPRTSPSIGTIWVAWNETCFLSLKQYQEVKLTIWYAPW